jgi:hypothetical protein
MMIPFLSLALIALSSPAPAPSPQENRDVRPQYVFDRGIYPDTAKDGEPVCLKIRSYIFERNDGAAPKLVRETTCWSGKPRLHQAKTPKARLIPAN